ncbi:MAG: hypothetical protein K9W44_16825 [Candidatus Lokiarchaeota archaeon]|nr:hypothetical protein [Candidatus Harpocratesius repetitus]
MSEEPEENQEDSESYDEELDDKDFEDVDEVVDEIQELEIGSDEEESLNMDDYSIEDIDGEKEAIQMSRQWYKRIEIDTWLTKMHMATTGIRQKDQYRAQSRQFTKNMEVIGDISFYAYSPEDLGKPYKERRKEQKVKDYKEVIGYNTSFWEHSDKESVIYQEALKHSQDYEPEEYSKLLKRLVVKTFTELKRDKKKEGHAGRWRGTLEESLLMSMNGLFGENRGKARPFYFINLPGYEYRVALMKTHSIIGDRYMFTIPNPKTGELITFRIKGRRFTPGKDFRVFNAETRERVAEIDDRMLNIGGKTTIRFRGEREFESLNRSVVFRRVLILFAIMIRYMKENDKKYKKIHKSLRMKKKYLKAVRKAKKSNDPAKLQKVTMKYETLQRKCKMIKSIVVTNSEMTLHYNPRRIRT